MSDDVHVVQHRRTFDPVGDAAGVVLPMLAVRSGDTRTRKVDGTVIVRLSEELRRAELSEADDAWVAINRAQRAWRAAVDTRL